MCGTIMILEKLFGNSKVGQDIKYLIYYGKDSGFYLKTEGSFLCRVQNNLGSSVENILKVFGP